MRYLLLAACMLLGTALPATARAEVGFDTPAFVIGINVPLHPRLVRVPGYSVYYAPRLHLNLFYYDGEYWLFEHGNWYASDWTDGPWQRVPPYDILRVPLRYYRNPPPSFYAWSPDSPPFWGEYWGPGWRMHRPDFDRPRRDFDWRHHLASGRDFGAHRFGRDRHRDRDDHDR
jgi:hypothetical protein